MAPPTSTQELQMFLGNLATYAGPFISSFSTLTAPRRELIKESSAFDWIPAHQKIIRAGTILAYYGQITLQANASTTGLGAKLLQDNKPIALASKALTDTESCY